MRLTKDIAIEALLMAIKNYWGTRRFPPKPPRAKFPLGDLSRVVAGSRNKPLLAAVADIVEGVRHKEDLLPYINGRRGWGIAGGEAMSHIYGGWHQAALIVLRKWALAERSGSRGSPEFIAALESRINRGWALWALSAIQPSSVPRTIYIHGHKKTAVRKADYQPGYCAVLGPTERTRSWWLDRSDLGWMMTDAAGFFHRPDYVHKRNRRLPPYRILRELSKGRWLRSIPGQVGMPGSLTNGALKDFIRTKNIDSTKMIVDELNRHELSLNDENEIETRGTGNGYARWSYYDKGMICQQFGFALHLDPPNKTGYSFSVYDKEKSEVHFFKDSKVAHGRGREIMEHTLSWGNPYLVISPPDPIQLNGWTKWKSTR